VPRLHCSVGVVGEVAEQPLPLTGCLPPALQGELQAAVASRRSGGLSGRGTSSHSGGLSGRGASSYSLKPAQD
jgi:hypothetical protein